MEIERSNEQNQKSSNEVIEKITIKLDKTIMQAEKMQKIIDRRNENVTKINEKLSQLTNLAKNIQNKNEENVTRMKEDLNNIKSELFKIEKAIMHPYERVGHFGYYFKLNSNLNYNNGQTECAKHHGHIIEFNVHNDFKAKLKIMKNKFLGPQINHWYVGLDDLTSGGVWKWSSSGIQVDTTVGQPPWSDHEPNNIGKYQNDFYGPISYFFSKKSNS